MVIYYCEIRVNDRLTTYGRRIYFLRVLVDKLNYKSFTTDNTLHIIIHQMILKRIKNFDFVHQFHSNINRARSNISNKLIHISLKTFNKKQTLREKIPRQQ